MPAPSPNLHLAIGASRALGVALAATHAGAIGCVAALPLDAGARAAVAVAIVAAAAHAIRVHALRRGRRAVVAVARGAGGWRLTRRDGSAEVATTVRARLCHPWLVVVEPCRPGARPIAVAADAVAAEPFRRLRAALLADAAPAR